MKPRATLDVVDAKTLKVTKPDPVERAPEQHRRRPRRTPRVRRDHPGARWRRRHRHPRRSRNVKTLPTKGSIHNPYVTPDGKYVVAGSIAGKTVNVFDAQTEQPAWTLDMDLGVRPMTFSTNADGSTKWIFVQLTGFQRLRGRGLRDAQGNQPDQESGSPSRQEDGAGGIRSVARHGRHVGRKDAGGLQPA